MRRFQVRGSAYFWVVIVDKAGKEIPVPPREPGRMCRSQLYDSYGAAMHVRNWLNERELGYPPLDVPWHKIGCLHDGRPIPPPTLATRSG